jgi:hypothetical protein
VREQREIEERGGGRDVDRGRREMEIEQRDLKRGSRGRDREQKNGERGSRERVRNGERGSRGKGRRREMKEHRTRQLFLSTIVTIGVNIGTASPIHHKSLNESSSSSLAPQTLTL